MGERPHAQLQRARALGEVALRAAVVVGDEQQRLDAVQAQGDLVEVRGKLGVLGGKLLERCSVLECRGNGAVAPGEQRRDALGVDDRARIWASMVSGSVAVMALDDTVRPYSAARATSSGRVAAILGIAAAPLVGAWVGAALAPDSLEASPEGAGLAARLGVDTAAERARFDTVMAEADFAFRTRAGEAQITAAAYRSKHSADGAVGIIKAVNRMVAGEFEHAQLRLTDAALKSDRPASQIARLATLVGGLFSRKTKGTVEADLHAERRQNRVFEMALGSTMPIGEIEAALRSYVDRYGASAAAEAQLRTALGAPADSASAWDGS